MRLPFRKHTSQPRVFLTVYDYGMGGIWTYVIADSAEEIVQRFPQLTVVSEPPPWMDYRQQADLRKRAQLLDDTTGFLGTLAGEHAGDAARSKKH